MPRAYTCWGRTTPCPTKRRAKQKFCVTGVGFEPTPPKRLVPETSALDRSAIQPIAQPQVGYPNPVAATFYYFAKKKKNIFDVYSPSGTRTRVAWVKTMYPDQLD